MDRLSRRNSDPVNARRCFGNAAWRAGKNVRIAVRPDPLAILILDGANVARAELPLDGRTVSEAVDWIRGQLSALPVVLSAHEEREVVAVIAAVIWACADVRSEGVLASPWMT